MVIAIFVNLAYHQHAWGYNFPIRTTPKKISISEVWVIFQGSPLLLALLGLCQFINIGTPNIGPQLGGNIRPSKNDPEWQLIQSGPELQRKQSFLR